MGRAVSVVSLVHYLNVQITASADMEIFHQSCNFIIENTSFLSFWNCHVFGCITRYFSGIYSSFLQKDYYEKVCCFFILSKLPARLNTDLVACNHKRKRNLWQVSMKTTSFLLNFHTWREVINSLVILLHSLFGSRLKQNSCSSFIIFLVETKTSSVAVHFLLFFKVVVFSHSNEKSIVISWLE